jgi:hypothetical protein
MIIYTRENEQEQNMAQTLDDAEKPQKKLG